MKILLACDLDGTLLVPERDAGVNDIPAEIIRGRRASFWTPGTVQRLKDLPDDVMLVPVTSRSVEQYHRIVWPDGCEPEIAIAANGGVLLIDGKIADKWLEDQLDVGMLEWVCDRLRKYNGICRVVDGCYAYLSTGDQVSQADLDFVCESGLAVFRTGRKYYFLPDGIDKAVAVRRLAGQVSPGIIIAAGDGLMDLSMLALADCGLCPADGIPGMTPGLCEFAPEDRPFSEFILDTVVKIVREGI